MNILDLTHEDLVECEKLDLTIKQLKGCCLLMGIPYSGTKQEMIDRLKAAGKMRIYLRDKTPEQLVTAHTKQEIVEMAKSVGAFGYPYTKIGLAHRLYWWRDDCQRKGLQVWEQIKQLREKRRRAKPTLWDVAEGS